MKYIKFIIVVLLISTVNNISFANEIKPIEESEGRFRTLNKMGWAIGPEEEYSQEFINHASHTKGWCLEVGAAYGLTAREAILKGARMVVNDLEEKHLEFFRNGLPKKFNSNVKLRSGSFLDLDIKPESIDAILASRVLHMLHGEDIEKAARLMYRWLSKGGKVYLIAGTPYQKTWSSFIPHYTRLKTEGTKYPGEMNNPGLWNKSQANSLPSFIHLLDIDILTRIFEDVGFKVERASYIDRGNKTQDNIFEDRKESCGLILVK